MANPRLSEQKRRAIEAELAAGATNKEVAKKLKVAMGTVSNVRNGLINDDVELVRVKGQAAEVRAKYRDALKEVDRLNQELSYFTTVADFARHFRPADIKPKFGGKGEATAVVCCNDWHFEERVDKAAVNGVNEFNLQIAKRRSERFWATAASLVDMCRSKSHIDTVVVNMLGDLITGFIHDELVATNELAPGDAILAVFDCLVSGLEFLKKETRAKEIIVPCICGNHGRFTKWKWTKKAVGTSFEGILYNLLARWFEARKDKVIRFVLPQGDMTYIKIYDKVIRVTHGDNIRFCGGIGGVHIPLRKALDAWNTCKRADYNYLAHWHTDLTGEDYRISGSLIGFNEYSIKIKARFQKPSQAFELQHPRYGATARFPIILE
jgi:hypothetical protein